MATFRFLSAVVLTSCILCSNCAPAVFNNEIQEQISSDGEEQSRETFAEYVSSILRPMFNKFLLLFYRQLMSMMIWMEFYTIATGDHFGMINSNMNASADWQMHRTTMAVSELWLTLQAMEKVQAAIGEATIEVAELVGYVILKDEPVDKTVVPDIIPMVLEKIELKLRADPELYQQYVKVKSSIPDERSNKTEHITYFTGNQMTPKQEKKTYNKWYSHSQIRKFIVNKLFVQYCLKPVPMTEGEEHERVVLAKAVVQLSKVQNKTDEVNRIYMETIAEIASQFDPSKYPFNVSSYPLGGFNPTLYANKTIPVLFEKLGQKFAQDNILNFELLTMKKSVIGMAILRNWEKIIANGPF